jgi:hypothetical protein
MAPQNATILTPLFLKPFRIGVSRFELALPRMRNHPSGLGRACAESYNNP